MVNIYWLTKHNIYFDVDEEITIHLILAEKTFGKKLNLLKKVEITFPKLDLFVLWTKRVIFQTKLLSKEIGEADITKMMEAPMKKKLKEMKASSSVHKGNLAEYNWKKMNFKQFFDELNVEI